MELVKSLQLILLIFAAVYYNGVNSKSAKARHAIAVNDRPIIGILAQKVGDTYHDLRDRTYIAASYVKYIESAGARVVPILTNFTKEHLTYLFNSINGVVFPGGDADFFTSNYYKNAKVFFDLAVTANKHGDYFPIWGTCLGFQTLHVLVAGGGVISKSSAENYHWALNLTKDAKKSRLFKDAPSSLMKALQLEPLTYNFHLNCVTPEVYNDNVHINEFFRMLSTTKDIHGKTFVSTAEAIHFPFYASQWHPEKSPFEWNPMEHISHTRNAVLTTQYVANFLVNEARKSRHAFPSHEAAEESLIYRFNPIFTGDQSHFEQLYIF